MARSHSRTFPFAVIFLGLGLVQIACASSIAAPSATPSPTETALPTFTPEPTPAPLTQWAFIGRASSERSLLDTGVNQNRAVGVWSVSFCGDSQDAWSSYDKDTVDWLDVFFKVAVRPRELNIRLNYNPAGVTRVEMIDFDGGRHEVFSGQYQPQNCPDILHIPIENADYPVVGARIWVDQTAIRDWVEVDAVELTGVPVGRVLLSMPPLPTLTPAPPARLVDRSYNDRPDDYPGMYQLHVVYALFAGQQDLQRDLDASIARSVDLANQWFRQQSGGYALRFDTYLSGLDVTFVQFDKNLTEVQEYFRQTYEADRVEYPNRVLEDYYLEWIDAHLQRSGLAVPGKYYIVYVETAHPTACGHSEFSDHLGVFFLQTGDCGYGRLGVDLYAWENEFVMIHEALHGLGFSPDCAPHNMSENPNHVGDFPADLLYPYAARGQSAILDYGNDDYFNHSIPDCPDLADSVFLEPLPANPTAPDWPIAWKLP